MYIVAIGWLYVTLLIAVNEPSVVAGIVSFLFYGLLPCSLLLWLGGTKTRRQRRAHRELLANQRLNNGDRGDTGTNQ
ncbi:hypothetical protein [Dechloromonas sp. HYN0024]|uniref:hypothetical protein n=1 Tax=Dechloromonas sp. HYN0024 TaxID=2231055 RepID=UPI000E43CDC8|nr:hypothetical protein [Dechloromonas sp. HYN0024]AXS80211.1 hypothetical protein HYN24_09370 [Dechloromonas sp. HYN0024]